jgi:hypothetical protein
MVFDEPDAAPPKREAADRAARPKRETAPPRPATLANVFVRSRGASNDRLEPPASTRPWNRRRGIAAMLGPAFRQLDESLNLHNSARFILALLILAFLALCFWFVVR